MSFLAPIRARDGQSLSLDSLRRYAPTLFAEAPHESRSARYAFISSAETVERLMSSGFVPVYAGQQRTRDAARRGFTKHLLRFQHPDAPAVRELGDLRPEIVFQNGHDGTSAYRLSAGLFRLVCLNGMTVASATIGSISVQHSGKNTADKVIDAAFEIVSEAPKMLDAVREWSGVTLAPAAISAFAVGGAALRWDFDAEKHNVDAPIDPARLLQPRRYADAESNLWSVFNRVQENAVKGGIRGRSETGRRISSRAIASVTEDAKFNAALWSLADDVRANPDVAPYSVFELPTLKRIAEARQARAKAIHNREAVSDVIEAEYSEIAA